MTTQRRRASTRGRISDQWVQYVRGQVTLSAADAFTQVVVNLPVVVGQGFVIEAHGIEFGLPQLINADLLATDDRVLYQLQLTKSSQASVAPVDDPNYIAGYTVEYISFDLQTAEKVPVLIHHRQGQINWSFPEPVLLPFEQIFFSALTSGARQPAVFRFRLAYKTLQLTTRQLPELLQAVT